MPEQRKKQKQERKREHAPASAGAGVAPGMQAMAKMMNSKVNANCKRPARGSK